MKVFAAVALTIAGGIAITFGVFSSPYFAASEEKASAELFKNPQCTCCDWYASYLRHNGYSVTVKPTRDLSLIRGRHGVPEQLAGCHTMLIGGYVVEGHVPVATLNKLLTERPKIKGISLPGMPEGSPGMTGRKSEPFKIYEITEGEEKVYAVE
jgi:hypothetical protein